MPSLPFDINSLPDNCSLFYMYQDQYKELLPLTDRFITVFKTDTPNYNELGKLYENIDHRFDTFENYMVSVDSLIEEFKRYDLVFIIIDNRDYEDDEKEYSLHVIRNRI